MGIEYVVLVLSFRRTLLALIGSCGEGKEMWWNAGFGFLVFGVLATKIGGIEAGSSGRPPAVGEG